MATGVKWQLSMVLLVLAALVCGQLVAAERCNPLLVLISGGGFISGGDAMPNMAAKMESDLIDQGIAIISVQNGLFTEGNSIKRGLVRDVFDDIDGSGYSPVVVIGHSWGAISALVLAGHIKVALVVTFDAVLRGDLPYPGLARRWINVYTLDRRIWSVWRLGGARDYIPETNENVHVDTVHSDVVGMFKAVRTEVYGSLQCPGGGFWKDGIDYDKQQKICDEIDGVYCSVSWNIRDRCLDQEGLEIRFHSVAKGPEGGDEILGSFGPFQVDPGGELNRSLACRIGTKVCFAATTPRRGWGLWEGSKGCKDCCYDCLSTREAVTQNISLTCNTR